jgi:hypothetical protein
LNWYEAIKFANAMSAAEGLSECFSFSGCSGTTGIDLTCTAATANTTSGSPYDCEGYRLPTEAEWEYAARAGGDHWFSGSDTADDVAWYNQNSSNKTWPVGSKVSNAWGFHDMSGNVWEMVWDWFESTYYGTSPDSDPSGPAIVGGRVQRGGSWSNHPDDSLVTYRTFSGPSSPHFNLGFRLARTIGPGTFPIGATASNPGASCLDILDQGGSTGDGTYWIDADGDGTAVEGYCDMATDGGGWTRVFGVEITNNSTPGTTPSPLEGGIRYAAQGNGHVLASALSDYQSTVGFTALRFECEKDSVGRKLHLVTESSDVLDYLMDRTDVRPTSTGSFTRFLDDTSILAAQPQNWEDQKWGHHSDDTSGERLYNTPMYIGGSFHWLLQGQSNTRYECDDYAFNDSNGSWYIYVR